MTLDNRPTTTQSPKSTLRAAAEDPQILFGDEPPYRQLERSFSQRPLPCGRRRARLRSYFTQSAVHLPPLLRTRLQTILASRRIPLLFPRRKQSVHQKLAAQKRYISVHQTLYPKTCGPSRPRSGTECSDAGPESSPIHAIAGKAGSGNSNRLRTSAHIRTGGRPKMSVRSARHRKPHFPSLLCRSPTSLRAFQIRSE